MIRAFPETRLVIRPVRRPVRLEAPEPFPSLPVGNARPDEFPHIFRDSQGRLIPGELIQIQIAHDGLGLHPPVPVSIHSPGLPMELVNHSATRDIPFRCCIGNLLHHRQVFLPQGIATCDMRGLVNEPGGLYVMPVGHNLVTVVPVIVEKQAQMSRRRVHYLFRKNVEKIQYPLPEPLVRPHPVKIRIRLDDMQMGVHRLVLVGILLAESHVTERFPVPREGLEIPVPDRVSAVFLYIPVKVSGKTCRRTVPCCPSIFTEAVYGKSECVNLLLRVKRTSFTVHAPVHSPVLRVDEFLL